MTFQERYQYNPQIDLLGKGGFARVYKAKDTLLGRIVALKFFVNQTDEKHTLIAEISKAIQLEHPNLCRYYDAAVLETMNVHGEEDKTEVGVLEYLDGGDLKTFVRQHPEQLSKLLVDVLQGLDFLHENGIIHRDLKTQNILIKYTPKGPVAKITDFGISKLINTEHSNSSTLMGTIEYMAPEQFNPNKYGINGKIATNVDLWSFGVMVYELVAGEGLFGNRNANTSAEQVMSNILGDDNSLEKVSKLREPYKTIMQICVVKDASKRVQRADDLISLLDTGRNSSPSANIWQETIALPKPQAIAETKVLSRAAAVDETVAIQPAAVASNASKRYGKWAFVTVLILLIAGAGVWWRLTLHSGYAKLYVVYDSTLNKYGLKDSEANFKVDYAYDYVDNMRGGISVAKKGTNWLLIKNDLATLDLGNKYDFVFGGDQRYLSTLKNGKYGIIDKYGKEVIPIGKYDDVYQFSATIFGAVLKGKQGLIGINGEEIIPFGKYDAIFGGRGLYCVSKNNKYGFIDSMGNEIAKPQYDGYSDFSEGFAPVSLNGKAGFIDSTGRQIIALQYSSAWGFMEGVSAVKLNGKCGFIDKTGKLVIPYKFDDVFMGFGDSLVSVNVGGKWGAINHLGNLVIPAAYDRLFYFSGGMAAVNKNGKYGFINKNGETVIPFMYNDAGSFDGNLANVTLNDKMGFINKEGAIKIPFEYDGWGQMVGAPYGIAGLKKGKDLSVVDINTGREIMSFNDGVNMVSPISSPFLFLAENDKEIRFYDTHKNLIASSQKPPKEKKTITVNSAVIDGKIVDTAVAQ